MRFSLPRIAGVDIRLKRTGFSLKGTGFSPYIISHKRTWALALGAILRIAPLAPLCLAAFPSAAQSTPAPAPAQTAPPAPQSGGKVIFSRSTDENGETTTQVAPSAAAPQITTVSAPVAEDADREAFTFTSLNLDVHLRPAEQHIAVRARLTVRNDGKTPLSLVPLQISSSLAWERIRLAGKDTAFTVATLNSDADHTGQLHEAAVPLLQPLAPGGSVQIEAAYSGAIPKTAQRLQSVGTPDEMALHSDWDQIGVSFTGLRGFGNVVWYPVASVPVVLGDGARLFDEIGRHKLRLAGAHFRLRLAIEYPPGQAPTVAVINGHPAALSGAGAAPGEDIASVATASVDMTLGFEAPSLFVAIRTPHPGTGITVWSLPEDDPAVAPWNAAAAIVIPFLEGWLGQRPGAQLTLLDLEDAHDAPFETGSLLATAVGPAHPQPDPEQLEGILVHTLTHAFVAADAQPPPAWLDEGLATFMSALWTEKQHSRAQALGSLEAGRNALALAEPESPGQSAGQPLAAAISPSYYRTKAAYVLWMLRDMVGDTALSAALRAYASAPAAPETNVGTSPDEPSRRSRLEKLLEQSGERRDLSWFFADWVDADKGLPDLSIQGVFSSAASGDSWLTAVDVANNGYSAGEVPVTVRSAAASATERVLVPARGKVTRRILIQGKPIEVQVNDGAVPETQAGVHVTTLDGAAANPASASQPAAPQP
jgi:hypothetical protein